MLKSERKAAEDAATRCAVGIELDGKDVKVAWGRSRPGKGQQEAKEKAEEQAPVVVDGREFETKGA